MKKADISDMYTIEKLKILYAMTKRIEKDYHINEKKFKKLCDSFDDCMLNGDEIRAPKELIYADMTVLLSKSQEMVNEMKEINKLVHDLRIQLLN